MRHYAPCTCSTPDPHFASLGSRGFTGTSNGWVGIPGMARSHPDTNEPARCFRRDKVMARDDFMIDEIMFESGCLSPRKRSKVKPTNHVLKLCEIGGLDAML
jgi:hypothetical protein